MGTDDGLSEADLQSLAVDAAAAPVSADIGTRSSETPAVAREAKPRRSRRRGRRRRSGRSAGPGKPADPSPEAERSAGAILPATINGLFTAQRPIGSGATPPQPRYAALDLGTNNCRLLIAVPRERGFRVVDSFSRIVRLGEGVDRTGRLSDAAMDRAVDALKICRAKLGRRPVRRARLIATEACRLAANGGAFIDRVLSETGLELEIVSQETEARLAVAGCGPLIDLTASGVILFDIGGGSSELVWLDLRQAHGRRRRPSASIKSWQSMPIGVVNLSERHGGRDVDDAVFEGMVAEAASHLDAFPDAEGLDRAVADGGFHMLGTSGTVTTLAGVHLCLDRYDRSRVDGLWMTDAEIGAMMRQLRQADFAARVANPCIGEDRADLVLAGCAILEALRRRWRCDRMRVADRGLREGVLVELMSADHVWRRRRRRHNRGAVPSGGAASGEARNG